MYTSYAFPDIMPSVTKHDLVVDITNQTGLTQSQVSSVLQQFFEEVQKNLQDNHDVALRGFGTFEIVLSKARVGRNPNKPHKDVHIPARASVKFRPSREMKERVAKIPVEDIEAGG